jgi:FixJ family two-component response regulator
MNSQSNTEPEHSSIAKTPHVSIVDDDESVREAIKSLLRSVGLGADVFATAEEFLRSDRLKNTAC